MSGIAVGIRTHAAHGRDEGGWATYVVLGGPTSEPGILGRGRMQLCDRKIEGSSQPFHRASATFPFNKSNPMDLKSAEAFIARCVKSSRDLAGRALDEIVSRHGALKACCVLTGPERPLPPLPAILASHGTMHAAEREFFRTAVRDASAGRKIATTMVIEKDLPKLAGLLPGTETSRRSLLSAFGKEVGTPWAQDEKFAALAAWLGLTRGKSRASWARK